MNPIDDLLKIKDPIEFDSQLLEIINCQDDAAIENYPQIAKLSVITYAFCLETNSGGISQFLLNSSGAWAHELIECLDLLGANKTMKIMLRVAKEFSGGKIPKKSDDREKAFETIAKMRGGSDLFRKEDQMCVDSGEGILSLLQSYVIAHKDELRTFVNQRNTQ
jgi:hypothetical protein